MASAIERSVRRALLKGDAANPDFRVQVYEAAERAILRVVSDKDWDDAAVEQQRQELMAAIEAIEADYPPAPHQNPPEAEGSGAVAAGDDAFVDAPASGAADDRRASSPRQTAGGSPRGAAATVAVTAGDPPIETAPAITTDRWQGEANTDTEADEAWSPGNRRARPARRTRRRLVLVAGALAVLLLLAAGAWFTLTRVLPGLFAVEPEGGRTGSRVRVTSLAESGDQSSRENWIEIFTGNQIDRAVAEDGGRVKSIEGAGGRPAVQIQGGAEAKGAEPALLIGPGIVRRLAGRTARGELTVGSPDDTPRAFTLRCLFADETACGRQRFSTTIAEETFVFDMDVPASADGVARLAIAPGIEGGARDLNVYDFRLRVVD